MKTENCRSAMDQRPKTNVEHARKRNLFNLNNLIDYGDR